MSCLARPFEGGLALTGYLGIKNHGRAMREPDGGDLGFSYRATKRGEVFVHHRGRLATTLRGDAAADFLLEVEGADAGAQQQIMARVTGSYRRGNERLAKSHPRNR